MTALDLSTDAFTIALGNSAHQRAEADSEQHADFDKAEVVYLNTLSVYAIEHYLTLLGYSTNLAESDSRNLLMQAVTDGAGLMISGLGQVEGCPIEPGDTTMTIPPDTWDRRIAYIAVEFDDDLEEATILGFVPGAVAKSKPELVLLETLRPLSNLTGHLNQFEVPEMSEAIDLGAWWQNTFQPGWEAIAQLLRPDQLDPAFAFRSRRRSLTPGTSVQDAARQEAQAQMQEVERGTKITLGDHTLSLFMHLQQADEEGYAVFVNFFPGEAQYLPTGLHLAILDETNAPVLEAHAKENSQDIGMDFKGKTGDRFGVRIALDGMSVTREFLL